MKIFAVTTLAIMLSTAAVAQDNAPNATDKRNPLPFSDSQVTNLFNRGYTIFGGEVGSIRIVSRADPARVYFAKIGDYIGSYSIDRVEGTGDHCVVYLVRSNETVEVRAFNPSETE